MAGRGRPPLTEDAVRQRVADYCARYGVSALSATGLPVFPAGRRESPQHREWIILYKAVQRLQRRQRGGDVAARTAALQSQGGSCALCLESLPVDDAVALPAGASLAVVHPACHAVARTVAKLGPPVLDRLRQLLWPDGRPPRRRKAG